MHQREIHLGFFGTHNIKQAVSSLLPTQTNYRFCEGHCLDVSCLEDTLRDINNSIAKRLNWSVVKKTSGEVTYLTPHQRPAHCAKLTRHTRVSKHKEQTCTGR